MADTFGLTSLPLASPVGTASIADPGRDVLLSFLSAVITAECATAWAVRAPGEPVIRNGYAHDPNEEDFVAKRLPALYVYRGDAKPGQFTDAEFGDETPVNALWVFPPAPSLRQYERRAIAQGLSRAIHKALGPLNGRHPSWVVAGDTDPYAAAYGSSVLTHGGFEWVRLTSSSEAAVKVGSDEFAAVLLELGCREDFVAGTPTGLGTEIHMTIEQNGHADPAFVQQQYAAPSGD
jgi:hypothetical protein